MTWRLTAWNRTPRRYWLDGVVSGRMSTIGPRYTTGPCRLPAQVLARTLPALLREAARAAPDRIAVIADSCTGGSVALTYYQLLDGARRLAGFLAARHVGPGDRVGILFDGHGAAEAHLVYHAVHEIGAIAVPLNSRYVAREMVYAAQAAGLFALAYDAAFAPTVAAVADELPDLLLIEAGRSSKQELPGADPLQAGLDAPPAEAAVAPAEDDEADWIFTSGTTGHPKAVALTHGASVACGYEAIGVWGLDHRSVYQSSAPFFTSTGCHTNLLACLAAACTYVVEPEFDVRATLERIARYRTTSLFLVSTMIALMVDRLTPQEWEEVDLSSLERLCYGAQAMSRTFYERVERIFGHREGIELVHLYGLTEAGPTGLLVPPERHHEALEHIGSYGMPIGSTGFTDWVKWRVADSTGSEVRPGQVGEIHLRAPSLMSRYVDDPAATQSKLVDGWLHTGDMGIVDDDGFVYFVDRSAHSIRRAGLNVSSVEIEAVIGDHPGVLQVAVVGRPDPVLGEEIEAYVVRAAGSTVTAEELRAHCAALLADYKVPRRFEFRDALPTNAMNRVVKSELRGDRSAGV